MKTPVRAARLALSAAGLVLLGVLAAPAAAQEGSGREETAERGWIGVGIRQAVRCDARTEADGRDGRGRASAGCRPVVLADAVIQGGPADSAGLQPGDTLIAVNGRALSRRSGQDELLSFRPERPAQLLVGRPGGRVSLRVFPERRPPEAGRAPVWVEPGKSTAAPSLVRPGALAEADSGAVERGRVRVVGEGSFRIGTFRWGEDGEVYVEWSEGDSVRLRRLEDVAPRIRQIRDSVFSVAKEQLEEVRKHQRETLREAVEARRERVRELMEERERNREAALPEDVPPPPLAPAARLRVAGAEFRPLSPPLAEYFPGADHGLLVLQVVPGTPAAALGLRSGDVVVQAADRRVFDASDLRSALSGYPTAARDSVVVRWVRKGREMTGTLRHP